MQSDILHAIQDELYTIEKAEQVKILLAVESGSRAWGFASPDSDYDVRFLYIRPREHYLRLDQTRDVIEWKLDDVLDINGWDFNKTLRLLHTSNPTLFEWLQSPIVYHRASVMDGWMELMRSYFLSKAALYHYLHMAGSNNREFLHGERVKLKKYFYVLRPILACRHILAEGTPPPMLFDTLVQTQMHPSLLSCVTELLARKQETSELGEGARIPALNEYIEESLVALRKQIDALPGERKQSWEPLNELFLQVLAETGGISSEFEGIPV